MQICILKADLDNFKKLCAMYDISYIKIDELEFQGDIMFTEYIFEAVIDPNMENQYFNWFELGAMFERHKFADQRRIVNELKKKYSNETL